MGIFITLALAMFITLIYYIGEKQQLFSNTLLISGVFKVNNELEVGNNAWISGINIGVIDNIKMIADTAVRVFLLLV